jgi:hypothetical protein
MFHAYYQKLKVSIESFPCISLRTLHQYRPIEKFRTDPHFIYITMLRDENKEELQSYYKVTDEDMEQITKEWTEEFLAHVADEELSDTDTIGSSMVTRVEHVKQSSGTKNKKKQEEGQDIETDEKVNASEENGSGWLRGGGDEADGKGGGEDTPSKYPPTGIVTLQKRKVSPK